MAFQMGIVLVVALLSDKKLNGFFVLGKSWSFCQKAKEQIC